MFGLHECIHIVWECGRLTAFPKGQFVKSAIFKSTGWFCRYRSETIFYKKLCYWDNDLKIYIHILGKMQNIYQITSHHISYQITSYHIPYHIISCRVVSCHIIYHSISYTACGGVFRVRGRGSFVWDRDLLCVSGGCMHDIYTYCIDLVILVTQRG